MPTPTGESPPTNPIRTQPPATPDRTVVLIVVGLLAAWVLAMLVTRSLPDGFSDDAEHRAAVERTGESAGTLNVATGTDRITIVTDGDLGGELAVATTDAESRAVPALDRDGTRLTLTTRDDGDGGDDGPADVTVRLATGVRWSVILGGGTRELSVDLSAGQAAAVDVNQGVGAIDVRLPRPLGVLRLRVAGGAGTVAVHLPDDVPARATFAAGAGSATLDDQQRRGVAAGAVLTTPDWSADADRIDVALDSGVGTATIDRS